VDICAALIGSDYDTAREYWRKFKYNYSKRENQSVAFCDQLKFPSPDGKYYFTEALGIKEVAYLIQIIPSQKAEPFRLWLAEMVAANAIIDPFLIEAGKSAANQIKTDYKNNPEKLAERKQTTKERII